MGDGFDDREMAFVATPSDIENAINGLIYTVHCDYQLKTNVI